MPLRVSSECCRMTCVHPCPNAWKSKLLNKILYVPTTLGTANLQVGNIYLHTSIFKKKSKKKWLHDFYGMESRFYGWYIVRVELYNDSKAKDLHKIAFLCN